MKKFFFICQFVFHRVHDLFKEFIISYFAWVICCDSTNVKLIFNHIGMIFHVINVFSCFNVINQNARVQTILGIKRITITGLPRLLESPPFFFSLLDSPFFFLKKYQSLLECPRGFFVTVTTIF